jgi:protein-S-isoprenylcysteine O-methyltransferase Ste14
MRIPPLVELDQVSTSKHIRAILSLLVMGTIVIPGFFLYLTGPDGSAFSLPRPWNWILLLGGLASICIGLVLFISTVRLFVIIGKGALVPWNPTQRFVVQGVYRHVSNPMISGVCCILLGETLITVSLALFCWLLVFLLANMIYMPLSEEPGLEKQSGDEYTRYKGNVPRWIPRLTAWQGARNDKVWDGP